MKIKILFFFLFLPGVVFPQIMEPQLFPFTDPAIKMAQPIVFNSQKIMMTYVIRDTLKYSLTTDGGLTWQNPKDIYYCEGLISYSALRLNSGRIIIIWSRPGSYLSKIISDDGGINWTSSQISNLLLTDIKNLMLTQSEDNKLWLTMTRTNTIYYTTSLDNGDTWSNSISFATGNKKFLSITSTGTGKLLASYQDSTGGNNNIYVMSSVDNGNTWGSRVSIATTNLSEEKPMLITTGLNTVYLIYQVRKPTPLIDFNQYDIHYLKTTDGGNTWVSGTQFTRFIGDDILIGAYRYDNKPFVSFLSKRYSNQGLNQLYLGIIGTTLDLTPPPFIFKSEYTLSNVGTPITFRAYVYDDTTIANVRVLFPGGEIFELYDDGMHNDFLAGDFIYGNVIDNITLKFYESITVNNLKLPLSNYGVLGDNVSTSEPIHISVQDIQGISSNYSETLRFQHGIFDNQVILFSGGFMLSGYNGSFLWANGVTTSYRMRDYLTGIVGSNPDDPKNKLYVLRKNDPPFGTSWQNWRDAVSLGAYFYDGDNDGIYNPVDKNGNGLWDPNEDMPDILGDETIWCVYNDGVPANERRFSDVPPQGIEIRQTVFASNKPQLNNTVFIRYSILNKGTVTNVLDSVYFSTWTDPDIGDYTNDLVGSDTLLNSGFTYNDVTDTLYGSNPPAFFTTLLQGPWIYTGNSSDTAFNNRGKILGRQIITGYKNLNISSFWKCAYNSVLPIIEDPYNRNEARNFMLGQHRQGRLINPCTWAFGEVRGGVNCALVNPLFFYSGDPVTNIGWIMTTTADVRMMLNVGPFKLQANNPIDIIVAYTVGRGSDHLNSITIARSLVNAVLNEYRSNFSTITDVEDDLPAPELSSFVLYQNYPNPFNSSTKIKYQVARAVNVTLKVYDLLGREITILVNEEKKPGVYEVEFNGSGLSSGVYFYKLTAGDFTQTKKLMLLK